MKMRQPAPDLSFKLTDGRPWTLRESRPEQFTLIVFYRGLHCPLCQTYLADLHSRLADFEAKGVKAVAVSADPEERAMKAKADWGLDQLPIGYGLQIEMARDWGLFMSRAIREGETPEFFEPGLFLVRPDNMLYYAAINSAPWARPPVAEILTGLSRSLEFGRPARGEA